MWSKCTQYASYIHLISVFHFFFHFFLFFSETENIGKAHISLAQKLIEQLEQCVRDFREMQREKRKSVRKF